MGEPWSVVLCVNQSSPWSVVLANTSMTSFADPRPRRSPQAQLEGGAFGTKGAGPQLISTDVSRRGRRTRVLPLALPGVLDTRPSALTSALAVIGRAALG